MKRFLLLVIPLLFAPLTLAQPAGAVDQNPVDPACGTYMYGHHIARWDNYPSGGVASALSDPKNYCFSGPSGPNGSMCARVWTYSGGAGPMDCHTMTTADDFAQSTWSGQSAYSYHKICGPYGSCSEYWL